MNYIDTSVLIPACLTKHPQHPKCDAVINERSVTSYHTLAEAFNVLTAAYRLPNYVAAEVLRSQSEAIRLEPMTKVDYLTVLRDAQECAVVGGLVYDALHAQVARRIKAAKILTYNLGNFRHLAPDLAVEAP